MRDERSPRLLRVLCAYLGLWVPLNFAALASQSLPSIGARGAAAIAEIGLDAAAAGLCTAAGWMLWSRHPGGRWLAIFALAVNLAVSIQALFVSALPRNVSPGLATPLAVLATGHTLVWVIYVIRSRALGQWLDGD
jgi:hypothetical protein